MLPDLQDFTSVANTLIEKGGGFKVGQYVATHSIGHGNNSSVWKAVHCQTKEICAIKRIDKAKILRDPLRETLLRTEVAIMSTLKHPNIVPLHAFLASERHYYLVMKFCSQGSLCDFLDEKAPSGLEERDALFIFRQIMNGFFELRKHKIIHRDLKPENILVDEGAVLIGDFGSAKMGEDISDTFIGTPLCIAPEVLEASQTGGVYSSTADLWSIGVVFYRILFGCLPFSGFTSADLKESIKKNAGENLKFPRKISAEARDLLRRLLTENPVERINWPEFFSHPLLNSKEQVSPEELTRIFGSQGNAQSNFTLKEFARNKKIAVSKAFFKLDENGNTHKNLPEVFPREVIEEKPNFVDNNEIVKHQINHQIFFKYCHELNKVYFFIYSTKKLQFFLKQNLFESANEMILNLSLLALKKGQLLNRLLHKTLSQKIGIFKFNPQNMAAFFKSEHHSELLAYSAANKEAIPKHLLLILSRATTNKIKVNCIEVINAEKIESAKINEAMAFEFEKLKALKLGPKIKADRSLDRSYRLMIVLLNYCYHAPAKFIYLSANGGKEKFNWNRFYYDLERGPVQRLDQMLN